MNDLQANQGLRKRVAEIREEYQHGVDIPRWYDCESIHHLLDYIDRLEKVAAQLDYIIGMCEHCGDFLNGVTHLNLDEGQVLADRRLNEAKEALQHAGWGDDD